MDIKKINDTLKNLREHADVLSYSLNALTGLNKNSNYRNAINTLEHMKEVIDNQTIEIRNELKTKINEDIDNKYLAHLTKTNSPKNESIVRMGKLLGIKKAFVDGLIRTSNESRRIKVAKTQEVRQSKS